MKCRGFTQTRTSRLQPCLPCDNWNTTFRTTSESGLAGEGTPDDRVLATAVIEDRVVITHNRRHFIRLHLRNAEHAGIIVCTADNDLTALAARIDTEA